MLPVVPMVRVEVWKSIVPLAKVVVVASSEAPAAAAPVRASAGRAPPEKL